MNPCEGCDIREDADYPCAATEHDQQDCVRACTWKEAYARGLAEGEAKGAWDVVAEMEEKARGGDAYDYDEDQVALEMAQWLVSRGIPRPEVPNA